MIRQGDTVLYALSDGSGVDPAIVVRVVDDLHADLIVQCRRVDSSGGVSIGLEFAGNVQITGSGVAGTASVLPYVTDVAAIRRSMEYVELAVRKDAPKAIVTLRRLLEPLWLNDEM